MASQPGKQTIAIHILPNISKFDQLIEYDMRNIFLEKSCMKFGGKASLRPFSEKKIEYISAALLYCQVEGHQSKLKLSCRALVHSYTSMGSLMEISRFRSFSRLSPPSKI